MDSAAGVANASLDWGLLWGLCRSPLLLAMFFCVGFLAAYSVCLLTQFQRRFTTTGEFSQLQHRVERLEENIRGQLDELDDELEDLHARAEALPGWHARVKHLLDTSAQEAPALKGQQSELTGLVDALNATIMALASQADVIGRYDHSMSRLPGTEGRMQTTPSVVRDCLERLKEWRRRDPDARKD